MKYKCESCKSIMDIIILTKYKEVMVCPFCGLEHLYPYKIEYINKIKD
jgi:DNA-directed RNA polymerase subunit RPC12/RpoP